MDNRETLKVKIEFYKKLLGKGYNDKNYMDKTEPQLKTILSKYEQKYKEDNPKYCVYITLYNVLERCGRIGWLDEYLQCTPSKYNCKIFNTEEEAKEDIKEYKFNYEDDNGFDILKIEVVKL